MEKCSGLLVLLLMVGSSAQGAVASSTSRPANLSTPKDAARSFFRAVLGGDPEGVRAAAVGTEEEFKPADAMAAFVAAGKRLHLAVEKRFSPKEADKLRLAFSPTAEEMQERIDAWPERIDGDQATLGSIRLRRIRGGWRVVVGSQFNTSTFRQSTEWLSKLTAVFAELTLEVDAGEFDTAEEMATRLRERVDAVRKPDGYGSRPPTTRPEGSGR